VNFDPRAERNTIDCELRSKAYVTGRMTGGARQSGGLTASLPNLVSAKSWTHSSRSSSASRAVDCD
jgi:hypothetical protein